MQTHIFEICKASPFPLWSYINIYSLWINVEKLKFLAQTIFDIELAS